MPAVEKTGYVQSYKLELHRSPKSFTEESVFFSVVIADDKMGQQNLETYILERLIISDDVDRDPGGGMWTVSYGNVNQAIIATLKDALLQRKSVTVNAFQQRLDLGVHSGTGPMVNRLLAVEIHR